MEVKSHRPFFERGLKAFDDLSPQVEKALSEACGNDLESMAFFCGFITAAIGVCADNHGTMNAQTVLSNVSAGLARAQHQRRLDKARQGATNEPDKARQ